MATSIRLGSLKKIECAKAAVRAAGQVYERACRETFATGCIVRWKHGRRLRTGTVLELFAFGELSHLVVVSDASRKRLRVSAWKIEEMVEDRSL